MNHQPFEEWLLEPEPLTPKQKSELQAHLKDCPNCSALAEVGLALQSTRMAAPAEGFTGRFQVRLEARKLALRRRNIWGFVLLTVGVLLVISWLAWPLVSPIIHSPVNTLAYVLAWLIALWTSLQAMGQVSELFIKILPGFVPPFIWLVLILGAGGWGLLWIVSLMKFVKLPQGA